MVLEMKIDYEMIDDQVESWYPNNEEVDDKVIFNVK